MNLDVRNPAERIVCLTEEPTEILYELGEEQRIVGISAYTVRPPEAKRDKPVVSAFIDGHLDKILELEPDLVVGFSDIQADLAQKLIKNGLQVLIFNQRSIQEILDVILMLGRIVGKQSNAEELIRGYVKNLGDVEEAGKKLSRHPRVYFEEWPDPMISGIQWVSELIELAGGVDVFRDKARGKLARDRFVTSDEVIDAQPDLMLASWCGKPFEKDEVLKRDGWKEIAAVKTGNLHEIPSELILQPGPACLTDGLASIVSLVNSQSHTN